MSPITIGALLLSVAFAGLVVTGAVRSDNDSPPAEPSRADGVAQDVSATPGDGQHGPAPATVAAAAERARVIEDVLAGMRQPSAARELASILASPSAGAISDIPQTARAQRALSRASKRVRPIDRADARAFVILNISESGRLAVRRINQGYIRALALNELNGSSADEEALAGGRREAIEVALGPVLAREFAAAELAPVVSPAAGHSSTRAPSTGQVASDGGGS